MPASPQVENFIAGGQSATSQDVLLTIIIAAYNAHDLLAACLQSIYNHPRNKDSGVFRQFAGGIHP